MPDLPDVEPPSVREPIWHDLDPPRSPDAHEARILGELAAFVDEPRLREQVRTALVAATCNCGCSSVQLQTDAEPVPSERVAQLSITGRDDFFAIHSRARPRTLRHVDVVLHVGEGRIIEPEVFHARRGQGVAVPLGRITGLQDLRLL
jgi:hypothetical protein